MPWNLVESTEFPWIPWKFHGVHENFMEPTKFSWTPWKFRGIHEIFMEPTKFSWNPWKFHGTHENFMGSMKFSWIPWKFSWKIRGKFHGSHERSTKSMESMKNQLDSAPNYTTHTTLHYTARNTVNQKQTNKTTSKQNIYYSTSFISIFSIQMWTNKLYIPGCEFICRFSHLFIFSELKNLFLAKLIMAYL